MHKQRLAGKELTHETQRINAGVENGLGAGRPIDTYWSVAIQKEDVYV